MKVIYCAGEQGRVVLDILERNGEKDQIVFVDDDESRWGETVRGYDVIGGRARLRELDPGSTEVIVALGNRRSIRLEIARRVKNDGYNLFSILDCDATISPSATVSDGVVVTAQSYIGPNVALDDAVLIDSAVSVSHDSRLAEGATVGPNATIAGGVDIGSDAFIGAGATILDHITIGEEAIVGAGSVVTSDVGAIEKVAGVPAEDISE